MSINSRIPLWGLDRNGAKRWTLLVGCLLVATTALYLVRPVAGTIGNGEFTPSDDVDGLLWITALLVGPFLVFAAVGVTGAFAGFILGTAGRLVGERLDLR